MARTFLGQNFLTSEDWQKKIVSYFDPKGNFVEIGPGRGALTNHLARGFTPFTVIEKDPELAELHKKNSNYRTLCMDFLDWDFSLEGQPVKELSLIGNLPYESGSAMLLRVAEKAEQVDSFVFLLQREVVERIASKPRSRDFSSFTVLIQGQFDVEGLDVISPEHFQPPPEVYSQILKGKRRRIGAHPLDVEFQKFLKRSFLNKRKTLRNAWKGFTEADKLKSVFEKFKFSEFQRAEEIEVDLWPRIFEELRS